MILYDQLVQVIDGIRNQAPVEYKSYRPDKNNHELLNSARSKAYIHLFVLANFGQLDFKQREEFITDGTNDGGIDGYFIDTENRKIYFIQSKFRTNQTNYEAKEIKFEELLSMDVDRILAGETTAQNGEEYNSKVQSLISKIKSIPDIGRYSYEIILLANIKEVSREKLFKVCGGFPVKVLNYERCYRDILFPVLTGTYYNSEHLFIQLNLSDKQSGTKISYRVNTNAGDVDITVVFVPTIEIAETMLKYKNSILQYNPRCHLEFSESNINTEIMQSITSNETNEFALFNNGITMLSDGTSLNEKIGYKDKAQLVVKNPQIINGGQTAYSLAKVLQMNQADKKKFQNKEVLLKIITIDSETVDQEKKSILIEEISNATNKQNAVTYADRHSNDRSQLAIQRGLFEKYGILYERKRGEFTEATGQLFVNKENIVTRAELLRISRALQGNISKKQSGKQYYQNSQQYNKFFTAELIDDYYFGVTILKILKEYQADTQKKSEGSTRALRYGPFLIIYLLKNFVGVKGDVNEIRKNIDRIIHDWIDFERFAFEKPGNNFYVKSTFDRVTQTEVFKFNFSQYYRSLNAVQDLKEFFNVT
jgi:hypothetical protein